MVSTQKFQTIRQVAKSGVDTEFHLRIMQKQGRLPGFFSGRTFKVNVPLLMEQLDRESLARAGEQAQNG